MYLVKFSALLSTLLVYEELPMSWLNYRRYQRMRFITWNIKTSQQENQTKLSSTEISASDPNVFVHRKSRVRVLSSLIMCSFW